jgi:hypothetical protein
VHKEEILESGRMRRIIGVLSLCHLLGRRTVESGWSRRGR